MFLVKQSLNKTFRHSSLCFLSNDLFFQNDLCLPIFIIYLLKLFRSTCHTILILFYKTQYNFMSLSVPQTDHPYLVLWHFDFMLRGGYFLQYMGNYDTPLLPIVILSIFTYLLSLQVSVPTSISSSLHTRLLILSFHLSSIRYVISSVILSY